tara:strand:+ start:20767 stop:21039 length:273 start_codon:yes stop_codon:yes gene_type:complete
MPDNLPNIKLPNDVFVNLYTEAGITVGAQIEVQNIGSADVSLYSKATTPVLDDGKQIIKRGEYMENDTGDSGAWAISQHQDGLLNVKVSL